MNFIELHNVSLEYQTRHVLEDVSETIERGSVYAITGVTGSGKSTLLKMLAGLAPYSRGNLYINGKELSGFTKDEMLAYHKKSGFVFQNAALVKHMNVFDNLALNYHYHTSLSEEAIHKLIEPFMDDVDLIDALYAKPDELSQGEQMLISIIRAILFDPEYIFFDEPTENLDQLVTKKVLKIMHTLKEQGKTMIISTHNPDLAFSIADRIGVLSEKRIVESKSIHEIMNTDNELCKELLHI